MQNPAKQRVILSATTRTRSVQAHRSGSSHGPVCNGRWPLLKLLLMAVNHRCW